MLTYLVILILVGVLIEVLSVKFALNGVEYDLRLSKTMVESGERFDMISVVTNRRRRFLPFVRMNENVPTGLEAERELTMESFTERRSVLSSTVYLMPRQRLTRRTAVSMPERGWYTFNGATLLGGDFLGLREKALRVELEREVVVLPRPSQSPEISRILGGFTGDTSVQRFILEDPMLTMGFHEYTGHEPMKQIAWGLSAKVGSWMVRTYDHTVERVATVILNVDTFAFGTYGHNRLEQCYSMARALCEALEAQRVPYSFLTNIQPEGSAISGEVSDGLGEAHLKPILEILGRAGYEAREKQAALMDRAAKRAERGRKIILITPVRDDLHPEFMERVYFTTGERVLPLVPEEDAP